MATAISVIIIAVWYFSGFPQALISRQKICISDPSGETSKELICSQHHHQILNFLWNSVIAPLISCRKVKGEAVSQPVLPLIHQSEVTFSPSSLCRGVVRLFLQRSCHVQHVLLSIINLQASNCLRLTVRNGPADVTRASQNLHWSNLRSIQIQGFQRGKTLLTKVVDKETVWNRTMLPALRHVSQGQSGIIVIDFQTFHKLPFNL